ncbi:MAG: HAMP domain-containing histidine kinase [Oscillospiraceae bacterium]|nr:HAMP domain-containing histidine kinase [Oscillospiraceae bacterium]
MKLRYVTKRLLAHGRAALTMVRGKGITKRWLLNSFAVVTLVLVIALFLMSFFVRDYYYSSIRQNLIQRATAAADFLNGDLRPPAAAFVENFDQKDKIELQIINGRGEIILTSAGFEPSPDDRLRDYIRAAGAESGTGVWTGVNPHGERVMAVSQLISPQDGPSGGAVRMISSLAPTNGQVASLTAAMVVLVVFILFFMLVAGNYFISSIVEPVKRITLSANKIARGDFSVRLRTSYEDEIGELAEAINSMASELGGAERLKSDFISSVSHELRTPLTAIRGWGETLETCGDDPGLRERGVSVIIQESERLQGLVEDLLDFSRLQSGRMKLNLSAVDVAALLNSVADAFENRAAQENKPITLTFGGELPKVAADADRLKQVFVNIIDNSLKYSGPGEPIEISAEAVEDGIEVTLRDHGIGIAEHDLQMITRRFYKVSGGSRGFGIGLAVAEEIISLHHDSMDIESRPGEGTAVRIRLRV